MAHGGVAGIAELGVFQELQMAVTERDVAPVFMAGASELSAAITLGGSDQLPGKTNLRSKGVC